MAESVMETCLRIRTYRTILGASSKAVKRTANNSPGLRSKEKAVLQILLLIYRGIFSAGAGAGAGACVCSTVLPSTMSSPVHDTSIHPSTETITSKE